MGDQVWSDFATASGDDAIQAGALARRYPSRPRRRYQPRGLPLDRMSNLHLFDLRDQAPTTGTTRQFPAARQIATPSNRTGVALTAVCIAALSTSAAVYVLIPDGADNAAVSPDVTGAVTLRAPDIPVASDVQIADTALLQRPAATAERMEPPTGSGSLPYLAVATPTVQVAFGSVTKLNQPPVRGLMLDVPAAANDFVAPSRPEMPAALPPADAFTCIACSAVSPDLQQIAVAVFASAAGDVQATQRLRQLGVSDLSTATAPIGVRQNQVRFYHAADAAAAQTLAQQFDANLVDLTWYGTAPPAARLELWLADPT